MMNLVKTKTEKGFTLIELMIVVAIIGILAAIAIPQFASYRVKAFNSAAKADLHTAQTVFEVFFNDNDQYPDTLAPATGALTFAATSATSVSFNTSKTVYFGSKAGTNNQTYAAATKHTSGSGYYDATSATPTQSETIVEADKGVVLTAAKVPTAP